MNEVLLEVLSPFLGGNAARNATVRPGHRHSLVMVSPAPTPVPPDPVEPETPDRGPPNPPGQGPPMSRRMALLCIAYNALVFLAPLAWLIWKRHAGGCAGSIFCDTNDTEALDGSAARVFKEVPAIAAIGTSMGALHSLASLSVRSGNRTLEASWGPFYIARPLTGAGVSVVTYLVLISGLGGFNVTKPLPLLGWAALAGLYSEQALAKLRDVFAALLKPDKDTDADGDGGRKPPQSPQLPNAEPSPPAGSVALSAQATASAATNAPPPDKPSQP